MESIDLAELANHNKVINQHAKKHGIETKRIGWFINQVVTKSEFYKNMAEEDRKLIDVDYDSFVYSNKNENEFVKNNKKLMYVSSNSIGIRDFTDEYESAAMLSILRAYHTYTDTNITFAHYCCVLIKRSFYKIMRQKNLPKNQIWQSYVCLDYSNAHETDIMESCEQESNPETAEDALRQTLQSPDRRKLNLFLERFNESAKLKPAEKIMLEILFHRAEKSSEWVQEFCDKSGLTLTKQAVYLRKDSLLKKLRKHLDDKGMKLFV